MTAPTYLENIKAEALTDHILMRMGYKKGLTKLSAGDIRTIDDNIKKPGRSAVCRARI